METPLRTPNSSEAQKPASSYARGYDSAGAQEMTMAEFQAAAHRLGRIVVTNGADFEYAAVGQIPPGYRAFCMVDKHGAARRHRGLPDDVQ